jgi:hypothetical protein
MVYQRPFIHGENCDRIGQFFQGAVTCGLPIIRRLFRPSGPALQIETSGSQIPRFISSMIVMVAKASTSDFDVSTSPKVLAQRVFGSP